MNFVYHEYGILARILYYRVSAHLRTVSVYPVELTWSILKYTLVPCQRKHLVYACIPSFDSIFREIALHTFHFFYLVPLMNIPFVGLFIRFMCDSSSDATTRNALDICAFDFNT